MNKLMKKRIFFHIFINFCPNPSDRFFEKLLLYKLFIFAIFALRFYDQIGLIN